MSTPQPVVPQDDKTGVLGNPCTPGSGVVKRPLCIDLFCGLGGWAEGFIAEGYDVVGFDIERHQYGEAKYPAQLVIQDVLSIHGAQFRNAAVIVASPPCQDYSYMAMPWSRAKREASWQEWERESPFGNFRLNELFDACFRIQGEASEAAGHHIPMVVENVVGCQRWTRRAGWHYGSFYLWGDIPALMPNTSKVPKNGGGGSWFAVAHGIDNGALYGKNPVRGESVGEGIKQGGSGAAWFDQAVDQRRREAGAVLGRKVGKDLFGGYGGGFGWDSSPMRRGNSHSTARKAASAMIAKIPFDLAIWIARCFKP